MTKVFMRVSDTQKSIHQRELQSTVENIAPIMYEIENGVESIDIINGDLFINNNLVVKGIDQNKSNLKIKSIRIC